MSRLYQYLILLVFLAGNKFVQAQHPLTQTGQKPAKYMLCVGINKYLPAQNPEQCKVCSDRGLHDLHGCLNDVDTISRLFIKYYDFLPANIAYLRDQQATHAAILDTLNALLSKCRKGDYMVFFYSGHGSFEQEFDSDKQLKTGKGYRNTIIPSNIAAPGGRDINSVELNRAFSAFTRKGIILTVITDCCHSASNTRGSTLLDADLSREVKPSLQVNKDFIAVPGGTTQLLTQFDALTIGACQDYELSLETYLGERNAYYGAFTMALCRSVTEWSQAPVEYLIDRTIAKLRNLNKMQTPNMEAVTRRGRNLPGTAIAEKRKTSFSLTFRDAVTNQYPVLLAGFADDLLNNDILIDKTTRDSIQITNLGFTQTDVQIINKSRQLKGDKSALNFMVLKRIPNPDPPLKVFLGYPVEQDAFNDMMEKAFRLQEKKLSVKWINPGLDALPDAILFYNNLQKKEGSWKINRNGDLQTRTLFDLEPTAIMGLLAQTGAVNAYLQLPPTRLLYNQVKEKLAANRNRNIQVLDAIEGADYILAGHITDHRISYGWEKTMLGNAKELSKQSTLPPLTDFFVAGDENHFLADSLLQRLNRLALLANWLSMRSPPADTSLYFPYHLAITNLQGKKKVSENNFESAAVGEKLDISIENDAGVKIDNSKSKPYFIYIMSMDPKGNTYLIYPQPRSGILTYPNKLTGDVSSYHLATVKHTRPGWYHYYFMVLTEPVSDRAVFTRKGVIKGAEPEFSDNPLEALLNEEGTGSRGDIKSFDHWLLKTVDIHTRDIQAQ